MSDSATFLSWKFNCLSYEDKLAIGLVIDELARARAKHPQFPEDIIHQAGIVGEEAGELLRASINAHYEGGKLSEVQAEAVQTAATAIRLVAHHTTT